MRFELQRQTWIPPEVKEEEKNRFTKEGVLVITSQKHRTQAQNIEDALDKLQAVLDA
ncbi:RF_PROK_I domain-containing protein, partial [Haematococcus lacustris]